MKWTVEGLEHRTLLAVGPIPSVPSAVARWAFDAGVGTTAVDGSGNGHTATLGAGASWTAGNVGARAIRLNGSATGVATAGGPVVNTAGSFTVSAWVNLAALGGYQTAVSIAGTNVAGFFLQLRGDTNTFAFTRLPSDAVGAGTVVAAPTAPTTNTWYHLVGVADATAKTMTLYVDGRSAGTAPFAGGWAAGGDTLIGHGFYGGNHVDFVNGAVDEVEFFSSALSAAQVAALDQPAAYSFDDGAGTTAADVSGHGRTATLGGGASWASGRVGSNALAVNGSATGSATSAGPAVNTALPFSVSAWVKLDSTSGFQTFASIDGANTSGFFLQLRGDTGRFAFTRLAADDVAAAAAHADATAAPTAGTWYNLVGVNDVANGRLQLYVNGVLQSSVAYAGGWQATGATVIGGGKFGGGRVDFARGQIDDVRFYDSALSASAAGFVGTGGSSTVTVATNSAGVTVSPDLFSAFMEDINYGGEGGVYNDLIRNSGFNDVTNPLNAWSAITGAGVSAALTSDKTTGPTAALNWSGKLAIASGVGANARAGIANGGYFGVAVKPSTTYAVEFYAKASSGFTGPLTVSLESNGGTVYASGTVASVTGTWAKYKLTLTTGSGAPTSSTNRVVISTNSPSANGATIWFGSAHVFPPSYKGATTNHLRVDLMEKLAAMKPAVFRVPGGNYLEGNVYADRFQWRKTIGRLEDRPGHFNSAWGYWSTDGMGLDEYLQMAEAVGARPLLAVYAGYSLWGGSSTGAQLAADVQDAIDELHYVLDPVTTAWGKLRAANGHPAPYDVREVEVGNEDWFSTTYSVRYPLFYDAIRAAFPSLKIVATHTDTGGRPYDVLDEHYYNSPQWFQNSASFYDNRPRGGSKVIVGEYAANQGNPTNTMSSALGDATFLLGAMRNSDLVTQAMYAPIWANVNGIQWAPDLIGFDNNSSFGSPTYYAQTILANNHGTTVVSSSVSGANGLQTLVTRSGSTYYLAVINTLGTTNTTTVNLSGVTSVLPTGTAITLSAPYTGAANSIANPTAVAPVTTSVSGLGTSFAYSFGGYSLTVLKFTAGNNAAPTVATPAAASPAAVSGTTTGLSVRGADDGGEANLKYTWATTGTPPAAVTFSANGTNAAKTTTATFTRAGTYSFRVTITDLQGLTAVSTVNVTVNATLTKITVTPVAASVAAGSTRQFAAAATDQFGRPMSATVAWSKTGSANAISSTGLFTAGAIAGSYSVTATSGAVSGSTSVTVTPSASLFSGSADIGATGVAGSSSVANGVYTVRGSGGDIWGTADSFRFVYATLTGDGQIIARVTGVQNTNAWAKASVMMRSSLAANAQEAMVAVTPGQGLTFQSRRTVGGSSGYAQTTGVAAPQWIKLVRTGNTFAAFRSANGSTWTSAGAPVAIAMGSAVYVGLAVTAHNNATLNTSTFDNVSILRAAALAAPQPATLSAASSVRSAVGSAGVLAVELGARDDAIL